MGIVYEAEQESLGRRVALKILPASALMGPKQRQRFEREARAAAQLHHTNIVPIFGVGEHDGISYYVMQFINGQPLDDVLTELKRQAGALSASQSPAPPSPAATDDFKSIARARLGRSAAPASSESDTSLSIVAAALLSGQFELRAAAAPAPAPAHAHASAVPSGSLATDNLSLSSSSTGGASSAGRSARRGYFLSVARIGFQVADAMQHAFEQKIVHRDIKPANLILDLQGTVWVTDFGLAKIHEAPAVTQTGDVVGTLRYMAPEALEGKSDVRSDLYSLGLTLYELLVLRPAHDAADRRQLLHQIALESPLPLRRVNPRIPRDLETIVAKATAHDPKDRYQTPGEMAGDLEHFLQDEPIAARPLSSGERLARWARRNRGLAASLASVAALLVVGLVASIIAAGHFRALEKEQRDLAEEKTGLAGRMTTLANEKSSLAAEKTTIAERASAAEKREGELRNEAEQKAETTRRNLYFSDMFLGGHAAGEQFSFFQTARLLDKWKPKPGETDQPDLRDWEWFYLDGQQHGEERTLYFGGKSDWVLDVCWSPDGKRIAAGGRCWEKKESYRPAAVWDVASGQIIAQFMSQEIGRANTVAWSPKGDYLAAGFAQNRNVHVYEVATGRLAHRLETRIAWVETVFWTPDASRLVTAGGEAIQIWDVADERILLELPGSPSCLLNPDGSSIAIINSDAVRLYDLKTGGLIKVLYESPGRILQKLPPRANNAWSPDGLTLACCSTRNSILLIDVASGTLRGELFGHAGPLVTLDWSPDGKHLLSSSHDSTLRIWDPPAQKLITTIRGHSNAVWGARWSPDGRQIASGSWDGTIRIWDVQKVLNPSVIQASTQRVTCVRFSPTEHLAATSGDDGVIRIWRPGSPQPVRQLEGHVGRVPLIAFSPDGARLASAGQDGTVRLWRVADGQLLQTLKSSGPLTGLDWSPDGRQVGATANGHLFIWDADSSKQAMRTPLPAYGTVPFLLWSASNARVYAGDLWATSHAYDVLTGESVGEGFYVFGQIVSVRPNADRTRFGLCTGRPDAEVYAPGAKEPALTLSAHPIAATTICFSPDGRRIATGGAGGEVRVWDAATGLPTLTIKAHAAAVHCVDWSADGMRIVSAADDGTLAYHDASPGFIRNRSPRAIVELNRRIADNENPVESLRTRADILRQMGQCEKSDDDLRRAFTHLSKRVDQSPDGDDAVLDWISFVLRPLKQVEEDMGRRGLSVDSDLVRQLRQERAALSSLPLDEAQRAVQGVIARARIRSLSTRIASAPDDVDARLSRAEFHQQVGDLDAARADRQTTIGMIEREVKRRRESLGDDSAETLAAAEWLAHAYVLAGDADKALALGRPLQRIEGGGGKEANNNALLVLQQVRAIAIGLGRADEAVKTDAQWSLISHRDFSRFVQTTAVFLVWAGEDELQQRLCAELRDTVKPDSANELAAWATCVLINPNSPAALREQAAEALKQASALDANLPAVRLAQGMVKVRAGDYAGADADLTELDVLWSKPSDKSLATALRAMAVAGRGDANAARKLIAVAETQLGYVTVLDLKSPHVISVEAMTTWLALREARRLAGVPPLAPEQAIGRVLEIQAAQIGACDCATQPAMHLAVLQTWFGRFSEHADTCKRLLQNTRSFKAAHEFDQAAKAFLIHPSSDPSLLPLAYKAAKRGVELGADHEDRPWYEFSAGLAAFRMGKDDEARQLLDRCIASGNAWVHIPGLIYRGRLSLRQDNAQAAMNDLIDAEKLILPLPDRTEAGQDLTRIDQLVIWLAYDEAVDELAARLRESPQLGEQLKAASNWRDHVDAWKRQAAFFGRLTGRSQADDALMAAIRANQRANVAPRTVLQINDPMVDLRGGRELVKRQQWDRALAAFDIALMQRPDDPDLLFERAKILMDHRRQPRQAIADLTGAIKQKPDDVHFRQVRGVCHSRLRQWDKCAADIWEAVWLSSGDARNEMRFSRALDYWLPRGEWDKATNDLAGLLDHAAWPGWRFARDAALHSLLVNDLERFRAAVAEMDRRFPADPTAQGKRWFCLIHLLAPQALGAEEAAHLRRLASESEDYWKPELMAAIQYRTGRFENLTSSQHRLQGFIGAMALYRQGHVDQASALLERARANLLAEYGLADMNDVPTIAWQEWAVRLLLYREAEGLIHGHTLALDAAAQARRGDADKALAQFVKALGQADNDVRKLAILRVAAPFDDVFRRIAEQRSDEPMVHAVAAERWAAGKNWQKAIASYDRALTSQRGIASLFAGRARAHQNLRQREQAVADYSRALEIEPGNADVLAERAGVHEQLRQWDLAIADWSLSFSKRPSEVAIASVTARDLTWDNRRYAKAIACWNVAIEREPANWLWRQTRGYCYSRIGQWDRALLDLNEGVQLAKPEEQSRAKAQRALWYWLPRGDWRKGLDDYRGILDVRQDHWGNFDYPRDVALLCLLVGDKEGFQGALRDMESRLPAAPPLGAAQWLLRLHVLSPGAITDANRQRLIDLASGLDGDWPQVHKAALEYRLGRFEPVVQAKFAWLRCFAAMAYHRMGDVDRAKGELEAASEWMLSQGDRFAMDAVPAGWAWQDWVCFLIMQREAETLIHGNTRSLDAVSLAQQGDFKKATDLFLQAFSDADSDHRRLNMLRRAAPFGEAFQKMAAQRTDDPMIHAVAAERSAAMENWQAAAASYDRAVTPQCKIASLFAGRGRVRDKLERWEEAAGDYRRAVELDPDDADTRYRLAEIATGRLGLYDEAIALWTHLLQDKADPFFHSSRSYCYSRLERWDECLADQDAAVRLAAASDVTGFKAARAMHYHLPRRQWKEAAQDMRDVLQYKRWVFAQWDTPRNVALLRLMSGDADGFRQAVKEMEARLPAQLDANQRKWLVQLHVLNPGMVTADNRARLLDLAKGAEGDRPARLTAAIEFRAGNFEAASTIAAQEFGFIGAMASHKVGKAEQANRMLQAANAWVEDRSKRDSKANMSQQTPWQEWIVIEMLQREANAALPKTGNRK